MTDGRTIYGMMPVLEALRGKRHVRQILLARSAGGATHRLVEEAARAGVPITPATKEELTRRLGHAGHQGVLALLERSAPQTRDAPAAAPREGEVAPAAEVADMLELARSRGEPPLILVLDHIVDPQNLGALIRSAHALGAHGVVIPKDRAAPVTAAVVRASAGAALHVPIARVVNVKHALAELAEAGVWSAAAVLDGAPLYATRLDGPLALVIGSEGKGVSPSVAGRCDHRVSIPLSAGFDSLNASVAGGIFLYEVLRQRRLGTPGSRPDTQEHEGDA